MNRYNIFDTGNSYVDDSLENFLIHGFEPGGFLTSVLANDLRLAISRADHWNKNNLERIVDEVMYKMPDISNGSYSRVRDWCRDADGRRTRYAEYLREANIIKKLQSVT